MHTVFKITSLSKMAGVNYHKFWRAVRYESGELSTDERESIIKIAEEGLIDLKTKLGML